MLPLCVAVAAPAGHPANDDFESIEICSDDAPEAAAAFVRATLRVLAESKIRLFFRCSSTGDAPSVSFVREENGIGVELRSASGEQSTRSVPWLQDTHHPLQSTLALDKATTLGLFLGNLATDLQVIPLRPLPGLSTSPARELAPPSRVKRPEGSLPAGDSPPPLAPPSALLPTSRPATVAEPVARTPMRDAASTVAPPPPASVLAPPPAPAASPPPAGTVESRATREPPGPSRSPVAPQRRTLELSLPLLGVGWMPLSTVAPRIEAGVGWGGPRWWATATGVAELDSNFTMDGRTFTSTGYGARLGIRRTLLGSQRVRWDAEVTVVGHLSRYRRDGIADARTHAWFDLGAGLHSRTALALGRHVGLVVVVGAEFFPTTREASISNGPTQRINLVSLSAVGGPSFAF